MQRIARRTATARTLPVLGMAAAALLGAGPMTPAAASVADWAVSAAHPAEGPGGGAADRRVRRAVAGTTFVRIAGGDVERVEARSPDGEVVGSWSLVGTTDGTDGTVRLVATVDDHGEPAVYTLTHGGGPVVLAAPAQAGTYTARVRGGVVHLDGTA